MRLRDLRGRWAIYSLALIGFLLMGAAAVYPQPFRVPPKRNVSELGACTVGNPKIVAILDGASGSDCSTGGGSTEVYCYCANGAWSASSSSSGVTSVALSVPSWLTVTGSPITTAGTIAVGTAPQGANLVLAGPSSGSSAAPVFRSLTDADIPNSITVDIASHATTAGTATTALGVAANSVPLETATTGDFVSGATSGGGLTKTGTEGATLGLTPCASDGQVPKYTAAGGWACANDSGGAGDVGGPASADPNALSAFNGSTGKLLKNTSLFATTSGGFQVGSGGPVIKHLGAGYISLFMSDETSWTRVNAEVYRSLDGAGTIKATIGTNGVELASAGCIIASSTPVAGGGDTTLCRASAGAWGVDGIRYVPRANPIVTCGNAGTAGYLYYDDSGALCGCDGTSWNKVFGGGTCS